MAIAHLVLLILAGLCFALAALGVSAPKGNLTGAGLFLWLLATQIH
jgi:F0F1-type ATP synthase membrane subunit c/vacuolar-type H+-ATPase subunit K